MTDPCKYLPVGETELSGEALVEGDQRYSFAEFFEVCEDLSLELAAADLPEQAIVYLSSVSVVHTLAAFLVYLRSTHVLVPASVRSGDGGVFPPPVSAGVTHRCQIDAAGRVTWQTESAGNGAQSHPLYQRMRESKAPGLVLSSSGSSGRPKVMLHNLASLMARFSELPPRRTRCLLLMLPDHIGGIDVAFRTLFAGGCLIIPQSRTPVVVGGLIETERVTVLPATPTFLGLCHLGGVFHRFDCRSLKVIAYGAESMPSALLGNLQSALPGVRLLQTFGTSETSAVRTQSEVSGGGSFRIEDKTTEWKLVDGELWLRTPSLILGYLEGGDDGALAADGWFATGDLAEADASGALRIIGRKHATINIGGEKVNPLEIEDALRALPDVADARVHGEPHTLTGQQLVATVVLAESAVETTAAFKTRMRQALGRTLPRWKIPSKVLTQTEPFALTERLKRESQRRPE